MWTKEQIIKCPFENSPDNLNGDSFTEVDNPSYSDGNFGRRLDLTDSGYITIGNNYVGPKLDGAKAVTISMQIEPPDVSNMLDYIFLMIPIQQVGVQTRFGISVDGRVSGQNNGLRFLARSGGFASDRTLEINDFFQANVKHDIVCVADFENKEMMVYLDGQLHTQIAAPFINDTFQYDAVPSTSFDRIGNTHTATNRRGSVFIDELQMWGTKLPEPDIKRLFHGFHPISI